MPGTSQGLVFPGILLVKFHYRYSDEGGFHDVGAGEEVIGLCHEQREDCGKS